VTRVLARALLPLIALAMLLPAAAAAATVTKRDRGGVRDGIAKRFDLTRGERRALDIASTTVTGKEGMGVLVEVRFKGNVQKLLGRGHLRRAAIALILKPRSRSARPAVLASAGAGFEQRLLRRSRSEKVAAIRDRRTLTFVVSGPGFSRVGAIAVKSLPALPRRRGRRARVAQQLGSDDVDAIARTNLAGDVEEIVDELQSIDPDKLDCGREIEEARERVGDLATELGELDELRRERLAVLREELADARRRRDDAAVSDIQDAIEDLQERVPDLIDRAEDAIDDLEEELEEARRSCVGFEPNEEELAARFAWKVFSAAEVFTDDAVFFLRSIGGARAAQSRSPITAVRVIVPRRITDFLCPSQLPVGALSRTDRDDDTLTCRGGTIALEERYRMNLRTDPTPTAGMGGNVFGEQDGAFKGPFAITGP
jgi:hypothetical protein